MNLSDLPNTVDCVKDDEKLDMSDPVQREQQHRLWLEAFILRARRVSKHSLLQDLDNMTKLAQGGFDMRIAADGTGEWAINLPPEEQMESLAARVRPVLLQDEWVHHGKVLNAVAGLVPDLPAAAKEHRKFLQSEWKKIDDQSVELRAYSVQRLDEHGQESQAVDTVLAWAWFYGDVVHASPARLARAGDIGVFERYQAACTLVARIVWLTIETYTLILGLHHAELLDIDPKLLEADVVVTEPNQVRKIVLRSAPLETEIPASLKDPLDPTWAPFNPVDYFTE